MAAGTAPHPAQQAGPAGVGMPLHPGVAPTPPAAAAGQCASGLAPVAQQPPAQQGHAPPAAAEVTPPAAVPPAAAWNEFGGAPQPWSPQACPPAPASATMAQQPVQAPVGLQQYATQPGAGGMPVPVVQQSPMERPTSAGAQQPTLPATTPQAAWPEAQASWSATSPGYHQPPAAPVLAAQGATPYMSPLSTAATAVAGADHAVLAAVLSSPEDTARQEVLNAVFRSPEESNKAVPPAGVAASAQQQLTRASSGTLVSPPEELHEAHN